MVRNLLPTHQRLRTWDGPRTKRSLLLPHVRAVLFVLVEHLEDVVVGQQRVWYPDRERLGVKLRIVKRHFHIQVTDVAALEPLHDTQLVAVRMPGQVESRLVVEAAGFDDERVTFPAPDRVAEECRQIVFPRQRASIAVDLTVHAANLVQHEGEPRRLYDLDRFGQKAGDGEADDRELLS